MFFLIQFPCSIKTCLGILIMLKLLITKAAVVLGSSILLAPGLVQSRPVISSIVAQQPGSDLQIDSFTVTPVKQLAPGTELTFTLLGTPNVSATLTITGTATNLPMKQTEPGVYQARYTIRSQDQITKDTVVRANLQQGDRVSSVRLQQSLIASDTPATGSTSSSTSALAIDKFTIQPVEQLTPGTELIFTLMGTPKATATFSIDGVATNLSMQEVAAGNYRGQYVIRTQDKFPASGTTVTAILQSSGQSVRAQLAQGLVATKSVESELLLEITSPQNNSKVSGTVEVKGRSLPNTTVKVNVQSTKSLAGVVGVKRPVLSRSIQTDTKGNFSFTFQPSLVVSGTRYEVGLSAIQGSQTRTASIVLIQK
jgi:hypothetical protein